MHDNDASSYWYRKFHRKTDTVQAHKPTNSSPLYLGHDPSLAKNKKNNCLVFDNCDEPVHTIALQVLKCKRMWKQRYNKMYFLLLML